MVNSNHNEDLDTSKNSKGNRSYSSQLKPDPPSEIMIHNYIRNPPPKSILKKKEEVLLAANDKPSFHQDDDEDEGQVLRYQPEILSRSQVKPSNLKEKSSTPSELPSKESKALGKKATQGGPPANQSSQKPKTGSTPVSQSIAGRIQKKTKI